MLGVRRIAPGTGATQRNFEPRRASGTALHIAQLERAARQSKGEEMSTEAKLMANMYAALDKALPVSERLLCRPDVDINGAHAGGDTGRSDPALNQAASRSNGSFQILVPETDRRDGHTREAPRICQHGNLARQCELCEFEAELAEFEARIKQLKDAARAVVWFDWSSNDSDAVAAIERLREALK